MKITKKELSRMVMLNNRVLVRFNKIYNDHIVLKSGMTLYTPMGNNVEDHIQNAGTVERFPEKLTFNPKDKQSVIEFLPTHVPLKKGDKVFVDMHTMIMALGKKFDPDIEYPNESWYECEDELFVIIPYQEILMVIRPDKSKAKGLPDVTKESFPEDLIKAATINYKDGVLINYNGETSKLIMLNGYCLVQGIEEPAFKTKLILPPSMRKAPTNRSKIVAVGHSNLRYQDKIYCDGEVLPGQIVHHHKWGRLRMENELHTTVSGKLNTIQKRYFFVTE